MLMALIWVLLVELANMMLVVVVVVKLMVTMVVTLST